MKLFERPFIDAVNHVLAQSPWACERLVVFANSTVQLSAKPAEILIAIDDDGRFRAAEPDAAPDVRLTLPFNEIPTALTGGMGHLMSHVRIEGNAELAEALGFVFRNLSWDVEEDLSRVVGDIPARRIAEGARHLRAAHDRAVVAVAGNVGEYLTEESGLLVTPDEIHAFRDEVTALRDAVARAEKRVKRLGKSRRS